MSFNQHQIASLHSILFLALDQEICVGNHRLTGQDVLELIKTNKRNTERIQELMEVVEELTEKVESSNEKIKALWYAPPGGGPGYRQAQEDFESLNDSNKRKRTGRGAPDTAIL